LAGAGVGQLVLADDDRVELSNLHRQVAFRGDQLNQAKAEALRDQLQLLNADVDIRSAVVRVDDAWLNEAVADATLVLDCTDNFSTRQAINRACVAHRTPLVSGAAIRMDGQLAVFDLRTEDSPCYACVYGEGSEGDLACSEAGILGPVVGMVGTLQALAAIRTLTGTSVASVLHLFDGRTLSWRQVAIPRDPECPVCAMN
jgi:molybdopterin/thiamine biosynthesis adenylyltransferase